MRQVDVLAITSVLRGACIDAETQALSSGQLRVFN
jgi:hypothetical protein